MAANNQLQLASDANIFQVSGTDAIHTINSTTDIFPQGTIITLLFEQAGLSVVHNVNQIKLLGSIDYVSEEFSTLQLLSLGGGSWQETDRNCINGCLSSANRIGDFEEKKLDEIVVTQPTNLSPASAVSIYPNPTKYGIHVSFQQWQENKKYTLQLADNQGHTLLLQPLTTIKTWVYFGALHLTAGQYQLTILEEGSVFQNRALVILSE